MDANVQEQIRIRTRKHKNACRWRKVVTVMSAIVVFCTTYALILPAITMERPLICGLEEHEHAEVCYEMTETLICPLEENHVHIEACYAEEEVILCGLDETEGHVHADACFEEREAYGCGLEETEGHVHGDACYAEETVRSCGLEESIGHIHDDSCYSIVNICGRTESAGHTHGDGCLAEDASLICGIEESDGHTHGESCTERQLTCGRSEGDGAHTHSDACNTQVETLICLEEEKAAHTHGESCITFVTETICGLLECNPHTHEESCLGKETVTICGQEEGHVHGESCYTTPEELICDENLICELEEHIHEDTCYAEASDELADLESLSDWDAMFADFELTGNWQEDLIAIAETQLGYTESTLNFTYDENGNKKGYTRYGAWYGIPYGDWCAMFVAFCLEYAGISEEDFPRNAACDYWVDELMPLGLYADAADYIPVPGDLIFYDWDDDPYAEHIGIVSEVTENTVTAIEGNTSDMVAYRTYDLSDNCVIGYGLMPAPVTVEAENYSTPLRSAINESGTVMYHHLDRIDYQYSSHRVNDYMTLNYVLIPYENLADWVPNTLQWTSNAGANYVVAYCADRMTDVISEETDDGKTYAEYVTVEIEDSSYYSAYTEILSGIVEHAYPFITAAEMRAELSEAYAAGEIAIDLSCCVESEFIAAAQWAIWDATEISGTQTTASQATFPSYNADALNPLSDVGHTDSTTIQSHVKAIRDWLVTQRAPGDLTVADDKSIITKNADGTYDVETTVTLDRPLEEKEHLFVEFIAGENASSYDVTGDGAQEFVVSLNGLTEEELLSAQVNLTIQFEHMQVYVYDSGAYQDMISGQWGEDVYELSFEIDVETTSVDVTKYWSNNEIGAEYIEVQLYADGEKYGDPVQLNAENDWSYTWEELLKYSAPDVKIEYTVKEVLIPGYYSSILKDESGSKSITTFAPASSLEEGATYILTYGEGAANALGDETGSGGSGLYWARNQDIASADSVPASAMWTAINVSSEGTSAYLRNNATGNYLSYDGSSYITLSSEASAKTYFMYNHLYLLKEDVNQYLLYLDGGLGYTTTDWNGALAVSLYKYTQVDQLTADISFLITNTKTTELTSVSVTKEWAGRGDDVYPENVEVNLLQNGEIYGEAITLNAENGWYYRWEDLPLKVGDLEFVYTVEEVAIKDYAVRIEETTDVDGTYLFRLINIWSPEYVPLVVSKVDNLDNSIFLPGAEFQLYRAAGEEDEGAVPIPITTDTWGIPFEAIATGEDGTFRIEQLWVGETYYLVETDAPYGYKLLNEPIVFTADKGEDDETILTILSGETWAMPAGTSESGELQIQIQNSREYVLPETGGTGTHLYTMGGLLLMLAAMSLLLYRHKPYRKEEHDSS